MVYVRRRRSTRPRRRVPLRRRRMVRRPLRRAAIHAPKKFCETIELTTVTSQAGLGNGLGYNFKVNGAQLNNLPVLAGVFEQYCITGIKYMYIPRYTVSYLDADEGVQMPQFFIAENKLNVTTPLAESALLQEDNLRIFAANKRWSHYVSKPKPWITQSSEGTVADQVQAQTGSRYVTWLPLTEAGQGIDHIALRAWMQGNNTGSNFTMGTVYAKVYYALKEQH